MRDETRADHVDETVNLASPPIGGEEGFQATSTSVEVLKPFSFDDLARVKWNPGERGEGEIPLLRAWAGEVPVVEPNEPSVVPRGVVRRSVVVADDLTGRKAVREPPLRIGWRHELGNGLVIVLQPDCGFDKRTLGVDPMGPRCGVAHGVTGEVAKNLPTLLINAKRERAPVKAHTVKVRQQRVDGRRPRAGGSAYRVPDPCRTPGVTACETRFVGTHGATVPRAINDRQSRTKSAPTGISSSGPERRGAGNTVTVNLGSIADRIPSVVQGLPGETSTPELAERQRARRLAPRVNNEGRVGNRISKDRRRCETRQDQVSETERAEVVRLRRVNATNATTTTPEGLTQ